jgi:adenine/guanine phosphoribosyltransferase-like PRPP-binding protein
MYVRVKRKKTTYFVNCNPTDTTLQLKAKLQVLTGNLMKHQRLVLLDDYHILDDGKTLSQQQVLFCSCPKTNV